MATCESERRFSNFGMLLNINGSSKASEPGEDDDSAATDSPASQARSRFCEV